MGQQQLLLLVLGIVIVGLAVVAGINAFESNQEKSAEDAMVQEAFRIATDAKAWYRKPEAFGGGGGDSDGNVSLSDFTFDKINANGSNPWGTISSPTASETEVCMTLKTKTKDEVFGVVTFTPTTGSGDEIVFDDSKTSC